MTTNVQAFWNHLEASPDLREQARLAQSMASRVSAAGYLSGLAREWGFEFTPDEYLKAAQGARLAFLPSLLDRVHVEAIDR